MSDRLPTDEAERRRVREDRGATLFVEAGAGSGKTRALVNRVEALVLHDGVPMEAIAAITFTEKAAAELRDRIRQRFEANDAEAARAALQQLDGAAVGTLHSFAQRILAEHPVEARLPPGLEVLDEIGSQVEFETRWRQFLDELLDDPTIARSLLALEAAGAKLDALRSLALQMADNWDLVEERLDLDAAEPARFDLEGLLARFDEVLARRDECLDESDKLTASFDQLADNRATLANALDEIDAINLATTMGEKGTTGVAIKPRGGRAENWRTDVAGVRSDLRSLCGECDAAVEAVTGGALAHLGARLGRFVLAAAEERREIGRLEFHDLLVRARRLLRDPQRGTEVRAALRDRYQRILLDEFQDTDPIQIELAVLLATSEAEVGDRPWSELPVEPGRLFLVGDPKQSIYRFRRADIGVYLETRDRFETRPALTVNFRTVAPVIDWINDVFGELIQPTPGSQPDYVPLTAHRAEAAPAGPAVALLGAEAVEDKLTADQLRERETGDVARTVADALRGQEVWQVEDEESGEWRPARASDVCILLPARTSLAMLERALDRVGVPYRAETSSLVYASREIRELMFALRAVADPTDELATVAALRSFVYGCGDDDLAHWRLTLGRRFSLHRSPPDGVDDEPNHPVAEGLAHLGELHEARLWSTPAELLDRLVRDRAVLESAVATGAPRDVWRRLRFVTDQARAWVDAGGTDLRSYLDWARLQGADNARVSETVLPETDDDSVRIMTVHGSKGLEFPIVVLAGLTTRLQNPSAGPSIDFPPGERAVLKLSSKVTSADYDAWKPIDDQMDRHERLRLLYVAATRARDHLVVSLHREQKDKPDTSAAVLAGPGLASGAGVAFTPSVTVGDPPSTPPRAPLPERAQWAAEREAVLAAAGRRTVVAATTLAREAAEAADPGLDKRARHLDLPPWQKGRYGTAVGRGGPRRSSGDRSRHRFGPRRRRCSPGRGRGCGEPNRRDRRPRPVGARLRCRP